VLPNPMRRVAMFIGALSLLALAGPVASAEALEISTSQITSPAGPTYALNDESESSPPPAFTVEGTTNVTEKLALRCYYAPGAFEAFSVLGEVEPEGKTFKLTVEPKSLPDGPCVLRAVPSTDKATRAPGGPAEEAADPFHGPRIVGSRFTLYQTNGIDHDYGLESSTLVGHFSIDSVGDCGLEYSYLYAPETLVSNNGLFDCNAALYQENDIALPPGSSTRSELQIDGANAYSPAAASAVESALKVKGVLPGAPQVLVARSFNPLTGLAAVTETDPIVKCSPSTAFPPTTSSCTSFVSTGVDLEREWTTSSADQVAAMTDTWHSTDGAAHSLNALYDQETENANEGGGAYQFPGTNVFAATTAGQTVTLPAGLGRIYYKEDAATPGEGDGVHPQGAIVYDTPPSGPISVYRGTAAKEGYNGFQMPYQATIPAGGTYTLHMAFIQAYKLAEVESLASGVLAGYPPSSPPTLSISSPANGTTVSTPNVTVSGTVSDTRVITSLTVDGHAVSVGAGGAWSTSVPLVEGANTIKALATDQAGFATEKSVSVTYTPPPPVAHASQVGSAKGTDGEVSFTIACTGAAGTSCEIESTLTTVEATHNGRPVAVSARHHGGNRSTKVTVGSSKVAIPAGQRVTIAIALNTTGASLLARFGRLPVHLDVVLLSAGHRATIIAQNLTVKPHRRPRQKTHHHHHHRRH
jgi:hypothetical protein